MVVAVLTVFGLTHDLSRPDAIPIFLGYGSYDVSESIADSQILHGHLLGMGIPSLLRYPL